MAGFIDAPANFYIGRTYDPSSDQMLQDDYVYYDSRDLTTHGLVLGMTGSGKTGLCVCLLEEAALDGVPAIIVDPKGDISNLLLTFPDLQPGDFEPWVDRGEAERKQMDVPTYARDRAELWANGLADWGIDKARMERLKNAADYTVYTPGSDAGVPISILASLKAPAHYDEEVTRDQINGLVTAILSLAGVSAQPVKDAEHVFLSNIVEQSWRSGKDLTLEELILQVQEPPFEKLGVLPVEQYYPTAKRMGLVMALNNVVAAPSFAAWLRGVPLDIQNLLYTPEGKPRVAILSTAHLNDTERMFTMTLVLESLVSWMRNQGGTTSLRALLYIDEIFGYFPPVQNPPSKDPLLRLLKQARAFGLGVLLATQNPVDLDYKGLSNIGTWFIGRLQSEGDRDRIISGLKEAAASGDMDLAAVKQMVAQVKSRVFLMRNVHDEGKTTVFHSRWAMSYLAGPLTRQQIEVLMAGKRGALLGAATAPPRAAASGAPAAAAAPVAAHAASDAAADAVPAGYSRTKPPAHVDEYFLPVAHRADDAIRLWESETHQRADDIAAAQLAYSPVLLAQVAMRFDDRKSGIRIDRTLAFHVPRPEASGFVNWEEYDVPAVDRRDLESITRHEALYGEVPIALTDSRRMKELQADLVDYVYRNCTLKIPYHPTLEVYGNPDEDRSVFEAAVRQAAREQRDAEIDAVTASYEKKIDRLEDAIQKKQAKLEKDKVKASGGDQDLLTAGISGAVALLQGRSASSSLSRVSRKFGRRRELMTEVQATEREIADLVEEVEALGEEFEQALHDVQEKWEAELKNTSETEVTAYKKDIQVPVFGLGWLPHFVFQSGGRVALAPAYAPAQP